MRIRKGQEREKKRNEIRIKDSQFEPIVNPKYTNIIYITKKIKGRPLAFEPSKHKFWINVTIPYNAVIHKLSCNCSMLH